jgi:hypothetical protein
VGIAGVSSEAEDVRGLRPQAANRRAGVRGEAVVRGLRGGGGGGGVSSEAEKEMPGLRPKGTKLRSAVGGEEALVRWLREGARGGRELEVHRCPLRNTF